MKSRSLDLRQIKREWNLAPRVTYVNFTSFRFPACQHVEDYQIACHTEGNPEKTHLEINGIPYVLHYPHLVIKRPGDVIKSDTSSAYSIYFKYDRNNAPELPDDFVCRELAVSSEAGNMIRRLYELLEHGFQFGVSDSIDTLCLALTAELLSSPAMPGNAVRDAGIREAASWLYAHPLEVANLDNFARKFGFSRRNFDRRWKQEFGHTPGKDIAQLKITEAKKLLLETNLEISGIAWKLGYTEATNFIAAFRRHTGVTPLRYRRKKNGGF